MKFHPAANLFFRTERDPSADSNHLHDRIRIFSFVQTTRRSYFRICTVAVEDIRTLDENLLTEPNSCNSSANVYDILDVKLKFFCAINTKTTDESKA